MSDIYVTVQNTAYTATVETGPAYEASLSGAANYEVSVESGSKYTIVEGGYLNSPTSGWIDTNYYPRTNPSGYLSVNINYGTLADGDVISYDIGSQQWINLPNIGGSSGVSSGWVNTYYYPRTNPSGFITSGISQTWVDDNYYPRTNPSGFTPDKFGVDFSIARSGDYITGILYADSTQTQILYDNGQITGISYPTYKKLILYSGTTITGVKYE